MGKSKVLRQFQKTASIGIDVICILRRPAIVFAIVVLLSSFIPGN